MFKFLGLIFLFLYFQSSADSIDGIGLNFKFSFGEGKTQFDGATLDIKTNSRTIEGIPLGGISSTEASYSFNENKSEFCCDREYTSEPFTEMSESASNSTVQNILGSTSNNLTPSNPRPTEGQR